MNDRTETIDTLHDWLEEKDQQIADLEQRVSDLERDLDEKRSTIDSLRTELDDIASAAQAARRNHKY